MDEIFIFVLSLNKKYFSFLNISLGLSHFIDNFLSLFAFFSPFILSIYSPFSFFPNIELSLAFYFLL